jgi:hypothetical protein
MIETERIERINQAKLPESLVSLRLLEEFSRKFGTRIAPIALLKCCAIVSCKLEFPRVSVLHVAPTRALKTYTSKEVMKNFR